MAAARASRQRRPVADCGLMMAWSRPPAVQQLGPLDISHALRIPSARRTPALVGTVSTVTRRHAGSPTLVTPNRIESMEIGAGEKSRTPDLRITNALLYQLSYAGIAVGGPEGRRASRAF